MKNVLKLIFLLLPFFVNAQNYNGLNSDLGNLYRLSDAETRSISPENITGEKGKGGMIPLELGSAKHNARDLGTGWKVNPYFDVKADTTIVLADIKGSGAIKQIWMTPTGDWRHSILRIYWDNEKIPSVEVPVGDFFCAEGGNFQQISSLAVCVNPGSAFNSYWVMPFRKACKITLENRSVNPMRIYYQINYSKTTVPEDAAYFHAQFRREHPTKYMKDYTILDKVKGKGHYVGVYMLWQTNSTGWWGEGEIKFFMDGDKKYPTICGTGTEDYFCGSYGFAVNENGKKYKNYTTPYAGFLVAKYNDNPFNNAQTKFRMYRWHISDPVRFNKDLKITMQVLGWRSGERYMSLQDNISSVAFWYQTEPHAKFPELPSEDEMEVR